MKTQLGKENIELSTQEYRRLMQELRESSILWETTFDSLSDMMISVHDNDHRIIKANKAFISFVNKPSGEIIGRHCYEIMHHSDCPIAECPHVRSLRSGKVETGKFSDTGAERMLEVSVTPRRSSQGDVIGIVHVVKDVTSRMTAENKIREQNVFLQSLTDDLKKETEKANRTNQAKSRFLATMSHEIRTPLNGVIGMTSLLSATEMTGEQRKYAEIANTSAKALLNLINSILDFSKIEAGKLELETIDFDLRGVMEDVMEVLSVKAYDRKLNLGYVIAPIVPTFVRGDPGRLRQIIVNLVGNAVKFTQHGEVAARVALEAQNDENVTLKFTISDTGVGIPPDRLQEIFEPFGQVDSSTTRQFGGTGLGLTISRQLVAMMGGTLSVESLVGKGSTFRFTAVFEKSTYVPPAPIEPMVDLAGVKILIVDDHEMNRLLMTTFLQELSCRFALAGSAKQAMELFEAAALKNDPFRAAFIEMRLPDGDGVEVGRQIKAAAWAESTKLVSMTSLGGQNDPALLKQAGFSESLFKPVRRAQFIEILSSVLEISKRPEAAHEKNITDISFLKNPAKKLCRILIVEDSNTNQEVLIAILGKLGYAAEIAGNGLEALEALKKRSYDIVFMDCQMPIMDGYQATAEIRKPGSEIINPHVPIIAMTANALKGDREICLSAGMDDYMCKPVDRLTLAEMLDRWTKGSRATVPEKAAREDEDDVFREKEFIGRLMGDRDLAGKIMDKFIHEAPDQMSSLKKSIETGDGSAARFAHTIKGASSNIGAMLLKKPAEEMERLLKEGKAEDALAVYPELEKELENFKTGLKMRGY